MAAEKRFERRVGAIVAPVASSRADLSGEDAAQQHFRALASAAQAQPPDCSRCGPSACNSSGDFGKKRNAVEPAASNAPMVIITAR